MSNQKIKKYHLNRYYERKNKLIELLGSKCVRCNSIIDLQFDHINPKEKSFTLGQSMFKPWDVLLEELKKCQLLCLECHIKKTVIEDLNKPLVKANNIHGTRSSYRYCKCNLCVEFHRNYMNDYYAKNPRCRKIKESCTGWCAKHNPEGEPSDLNRKKILILNNDIKEKIGKSKETTKFLSKHYNVSKATIKRIRRLYKQSNLTSNL